MSADPFLGMSRLDFQACVPNFVLGTSDGLLPGTLYEVPYPQAMRPQETSPVRGIASGLC